MERILKATVRYDGSRFAGWQVQPNQRTVQGVLENALSQIVSRAVHIDGAGRTDAGVHALGQVFSFRWSGRASADRLRRSLSKMLGPEIRVESVEEAPSDFHACRSSVSKRYAYTISSSREPDPFSAPFAWCVPWDVDRAYVARLAQALVGTHDFAGFQGSGASVTTTVRTLYSATVLPGGVIGPIDGQGLWRVEFHGDGFLYKMVRNITGMLIEIARGKTPEKRLEELLQCPGPFRGHTAPPQGLALIEVLY